MITNIRTETQILDYSNAQVIATEIGQSKIVSGTFKILHVIDLDQYNTVLTNLEETVKRDIAKKDNRYPFLIHEIRSLQDILDELRPRRFARSIDALGTAWKWLAGTPDHDDFKLLTDQAENLLRNNENQIVINKAIERRLQVITNMTNLVLNNIGTTDAYKIQIIQDVEHKLKILNEELRNINYAIQWAKVGIVNSFILSKSELGTIKDHFARQSLPYLNLLEALEFGEVKLSHNNTTLIFIISLPKTETIACEKVFIKPVRKGETVINLKNENFILCKKSVFEIKSKCKNIYGLSLCSRENLKNITDTKCLPNVLSGKPSLCPMTNPHHLPIIEEIMPGLVILNGYEGSILVDNENLTLNGTFVVRFHNSTITIGDRTYSSKEKQWLGQFQL